MEPLDIIYKQGRYNISVISEIGRLDIFDRETGTTVVDIEICLRIEDVPRLPVIINTFLQAYEEQIYQHEKIIAGLKKNLEKRLIELHKPLEK